MTGWRRALLAAATVETATGVAAALMASTLGNGHGPGTMFITCTLGVAAVDMSG